ncbi:hypothetical protein WR25_08378 [Diploscapter pachys]|uniref:Uncharacterized protein n=1 Tax=Diploscapter pachys TaxID=2018661 RepID=A0A2A2M2U1_9BILA|nr:hypothetical protein WR25_08378 [Diploscapter pachys]
MPSARSCAIAGSRMSISSRPIVPLSPACGLTPAKARRGAAMPKSRRRAVAVVRAFVTSRSTDSSDGTAASGTCAVSGTTRSDGPASIITASSAATPQRSATNSTGPVTKAFAAPRCASAIAHSSALSAARAPEIVAVPGTTSPAGSTAKTGSARSNTTGASAMSSITSIGPSHTRATAPASPTIAKGGRLRSVRTTQLLAIISGPTPAGSPIAIASAAPPVISTILDDRVTTQVAQLALRAQVDALLLQLALDLGSARHHRGLRIVTTAQHQRAHAFGRRTERRGRLTDLHLQQNFLERCGQVADADRIVVDHFGADAGSNLLYRAAALDRLHRLGKGRGACRGLRLRGARREGDGQLLQAQLRIARVGRTDRPLVGKVQDRKAARRFDRAGDLADLHLLRRLGERLRQRDEADPAEIATDAARRRFGIVAREQFEGLLRLLDFADDLLGLGEHLRAIRVIGAQVDFLEVIFLRAARCLDPLLDRRHLFVADVDERLDLAAQVTAPGQFALDRTTQRAFRRARLAQRDAQLRHGHVEPLGKARFALVELGLRHGDFGALRLLDFQRLVDQLAQDLELELVDLVGRGRAAAIVEDGQRQALVDIGAGDDRVVDDRGRLTDVGVELAEDLQVCGDVQVRVGHLLVGDRLRDRAGAESGQRGPAEQAHGLAAEIASNVVRHVVPLPQKARARRSTALRPVLPRRS